MALPQVGFFGVDLVKFGIDFLNFYALYFAISLTLNLEAGYTGIPNFGKVLYVAGGAAVAGSLSGRLAAYVYGINTHGDYITFNARIITQVNILIASDPVFAAELVLLSLVIAALIGAVFGYLSSYPAIRLREDYLGMLLLAVAQFFQIFLRGFGPLVGGTQGIFVPDPYAYFASLGIGVRDLVAAAVISVFAVVVYFFAEKVARSPLGRTMRAVRDNEDASRALGKDDASVRRKVLVVASAIAGMAGALVTFYYGSVGADTWSRFAWTFWPWLIVIIGGAANNAGIALGALFFTALFKGLAQIQIVLPPSTLSDPNYVVDIAFAALIVIVLLVRPDGILRERPTPTLPRRKLVMIARSSSTQHPAADVDSSTREGEGKLGWLKSLLGRILKRRGSADSAR
ncbi:MAG TPA: branched-chain amino acid ABC transporter permease [Nitrososphaerales archaeon]|nr:branched-chain amino acid ABC transporter permease [Nitrososphaerales archaeon]